jgi:RNA polymerase sigma-70 factor, ECF subfamily
MLILSPEAADPTAITVLLKAWAEGDGSALERLTPLVYNELRRLARNYLRRERAESLPSAALVHEAYLRLYKEETPAFHDRVHFFAVSSRIMRRILVDRARARATNKRGGLERDQHATTINLDELADKNSAISVELIALDDALHALGKFDARKVRIVEMRFFGGLTIEETAEVLRISPQSVMRDWKLAKAWLTQELSPRPASPISSRRPYPDHGPGTEV